MRHVAHKFMHMFCVTHTQHTVHDWMVEGEWLRGVSYTMHSDNITWPAVQSCRSMAHFSKIQQGSRARHNENKGKKTGASVDLQFTGTFSKLR